MNLFSDDVMNDLKTTVKELTDEAISEALADFRRLHRAKDFMNAKEACTYLGISFNSLQKLRTQGLRVLDLGGRTIYSKEEINRFYNQESK